MGGQPDVKPTRAQLAKAAALSTGEGGKDPAAGGGGSSAPYERTVLPCGEEVQLKDSRRAHSLKRPSEEPPSGQANEATTGGATRASSFVAEKLCKRKRSWSSSPRNFAGLPTHSNTHVTFHEHKPSQNRSTPSPPPPQHNPAPSSDHNSSPRQYHHTPHQLDHATLPPHHGYGWMGPPPPPPGEPTHLTLEMAPCGNPESSVVPPVDTLLLDKVAPLGLKLNKTPSLLDFFAAQLEEAGSGGGPRARSAGLEAAEGQQQQQHQQYLWRAASLEEDPRDKMKASNFGALRLKIGTWKRVSMYDGDLVAKCYYAKRKLVWEVLDGSLKSKIEVQWADISRLRTHLQPGMPGVLEIELSRLPLFFRETNPQPRKHTVWQTTNDFTYGEATTCRIHVLEFAEGVLNRPLEKLLMCDPRLHALHQQMPPHSHGPHPHISSPGPIPPPPSWSSPKKQQHQSQQLQASPTSRKSRKVGVGAAFPDGTARGSPDAESWAGPGAKKWRAGIPMHNLASPISVMADPRSFDLESGSSDSEELQHDIDPKFLCPSKSQHPNPPSSWHPHHRNPPTYSPTKSSSSTHRSSTDKNNAPPPPIPHSRSSPHKLARNPSSSGSADPYSHMSGHNLSPTAHYSRVAKSEDLPHPYHSSYHPHPHHYRLPPPELGSSGFPAHPPSNNASAIDYHIARSPSPPPRCLDAISNVLGYTADLLGGSSEPPSFDDDYSEGHRSSSPFLSSRYHSPHPHPGRAKRPARPAGGAPERRPFIDSPPGSPIFLSLSPPVSPLSTPLREGTSPPPSPLFGEDRVLAAAAVEGRSCLIPKVDSSGDLLLNLPRIASMPKFL